MCIAMWTYVSLYVYIHECVSVARDITKGLMHAKQVLYLWVLYPPISFELGSLCCVGWLWNLGLKQTTYINFSYNKDKTKKIDTGESKFKISLIIFVIMEKFLLWNEIQSCSTYAIKCCKAKTISFLTAVSLPFLWIISFILFATWPSGLTFSENVIVLLNSTVVRIWWTHRSFKSLCVFNTLSLQLVAAVINSSFWVFA